jgi:pimeloyl-ACP methyl ester carboxylesterase
MLATQPSPVRAAAPAAVWHALDCPWQLETPRQVDCGVLDVPENRNRPESRRILLHVRVLRAEDPSGAPPVVFLSGGPGQDMGFSTGEEVEGWIAYADDVLSWAEGRDIVLFAQRGITVDGVGMTCAGLGDPRGYLGASEDPDRLTDWVANVNRADRECRESLVAQGYDLSAYSTRESAHDVEDLRRALGYEPWVLYGISYGTRLGLEVMRAHPDGVAAAVLDSVFPTDVTEHWTDPAPFADALYMMFRTCEASRSCQRAYPDIEARFDTLVGTLRAAPLKMYVDDPEERSPPLWFELDDVTLLDMVFFNLYWIDDIAKLPRGIDELSRGDMDAFRETIANAYVYDSLYQNWSWGMQSAVNCNDDFAWYDETAVARAMAEHPRLASWVATLNLLPPCRGWPRLPRDAGFSEPVQSDIPTLLLAGEFDPVTPVSYADRALAGLTNGRLVVVPGVAHGVLDAADCARRIAREFLDDPREPLRPHCAERRSAIPFELP